MQIVRLTTKQGAYEGVLLPSTPNSVVIKLANGYNIGFRKSTIIKEEVVGERATPVTQKSSSIAPSNKPLICILHLGGTIASKVDYATGAVTSHFQPEEIVTMFPELKDEARIESRLVGNMMSGAMQPGHYNKIADAIAQELAKKPKAIIISHGTDTIAWSAAAVSFILEKVPVPIIFVGSQRSSDRGSSDAGMNLLSAVHFGINTHWCGVGVCMHKTSNDDLCWILPATNVSKMHTSRRDAFRPINSRQIADVDVKQKTITHIRVDPSSQGEFRVRHIDPGLKVGIVKMHPGLRHTELAHYEGYDGLIIEGTGLGHAPVIAYDEESAENQPIYEQIQKLCSHLPVALVSQQKYGRINMQVYNYGRLLMQAGVIGHDTDMTIESAYTKLFWLLSNEREKVKELYVKNLRGEISARTETETFLI